jgi:hypothetical protein
MGVLSVRFLLLLHDAIMQEVMIKSAILPNNFMPQVYKNKMVFENFSNHRIYQTMLLTCVC